MTDKEIGQDALKALVLEQDGKEVSGEPTKGKYIISMKKHMVLHGEQAAIIRDLKKAWPTCEFEWKGKARADS